MTIIAFQEYIRKHIIWSLETFGPGFRSNGEGIRKHIRKELIESEKEPHDIIEWADIAILAIDGMWRSQVDWEGLDPFTSPEVLADIVATALVDKQSKNMIRIWPDWRLFPDDTPIEHIR